MLTVIEILIENISISYQYSQDITSMPVVGWPTFLSFSPNTDYFKNKRNFLNL